MVALHASLDDNQAMTSMPFPPPNEIEFDVRGKISLIKDHAIIEIGEIKSSGTGARSAVDQLTLRLFLAKWMAGRVFNAQTFVLVARIFTPGHADVDQESIINDNAISVFYHSI